MTLPAWAETASDTVAVAIAVAVAVAVEAMIDRLVPESCILALNGDLHPANDGQDEPATTCDGRDVA